MKAAWPDAQDSVTGIVWGSGAVDLKELEIFVNTMKWPVEVKKNRELATQGQLRGTCKQPGPPRGVSLRVSPDNLLLVLFRG